MGRLKKVQKFKQTDFVTPNTSIQALKGRRSTKVQPLDSTLDFDLSKQLSFSHDEYDLNFKEVSTKQRYNN